MSTTAGAIDAAFFAQTGVHPTITSSTRTAQSQASAMYYRFTHGMMGGYANRAALAAIRDAYRQGIDAGRSSEQIIGDMRGVIENQMSRGVYISNHLQELAIDYRVFDLSPAQRHTLEGIAAAQGGTVLPEGIPPHIHVQFPSPHRPLH